MNRNVEDIKNIGEEVINQDELKNLLEKKEKVIAYDGFEPSGRMHLAQGLLRAHNVNTFIRNKIKFKFWVADWFALMNPKIRRDLKRFKMQEN